MKTKTIILTTAGTALVFAFVWEQIQATRLGYRVSRRRSEMRGRRARTDTLRLELARLRAPARLADEAVRRLGMAPPNPESIVVLGSAIPRIQRTAALRPPPAPTTPPAVAQGPPPDLDGRMAALIGGSAR